MPNLLKFKMFICKLLTFWIIPSKTRKLFREMLFWFSYSDYVRFKHANYQVVSLGNSCLTRTLAVATGIKPRRFYGEKSCPFDLCYSDLKRTIELIEKDFDGFFNNIDIEKFPHDEKFNFIHFKNRYEKRIQNFLEILNSNKKIYYIYSNYSTVPDAKDINKLYELLKVKRKEKPFELIILTTEHIDVPNIIQIPYKITIDDRKVNQIIIDKFNTFDNKFTRFRDYIENELKKIV